MNAKWCVSTLIILLAVLGLRQEQYKVSNQQISLQFSELDAASTHDDVLAVITTRLKVLGVDAVEIINNDGLHINIRYYSHLDANHVKEFILKQNFKTSRLEDDAPIEFPSEQFPEKYNLVVSDLHQKVDNGLHLNGNLVLIQKQDLTRYFNPVLYKFNNAIVIQKGVIEHLAFKQNNNITATIETSFKTIPEVRAGPVVS